MQDGQPTRVLVLDNGAHSIKAAWADPAAPSLDPQVLPSGLSSQTVES